MNYDLIKKFEGFRSKAYKCQAGIWTIGYGTTCYPNGLTVCPSDMCTEKLAGEWLDWYIQEKILAVPQIAALLKTMNVNQRAAIVSLVYNIGAPAFVKSGLYRAIQSKDWLGVMHNWDWVRAAGEISLGICKRRTAELALFFG